MVSLISIPLAMLKRCSLSEGSCVRTHVGMWQGQVWIRSCGALLGGVYLTFAKQKYCFAVHSTFRFSGHQNQLRQLPFRLIVTRITASATSIERCVFAYVHMLVVSMGKLPPCGPRAIVVQYRSLCGSQPHETRCLLIVD